MNISLKYPHENDNDEVLMRHHHRDRDDNLNEF